MEIMTDKGLVIGLVAPDEQPKAAAKPAPVMEKVSAPVEEDILPVEAEKDDEIPVMVAEPVAPDAVPRRRGRPRKNPV